MLRHYAHMLPGQLALVDDLNESPRPPDVELGMSRGSDPLLSRPHADVGTPRPHADVGPPSAAAAGGKK